MLYRNGKGDNCSITNEVGLALCEAFVAYDAGDYSKATNLVYPVRYKILTIGGSNAQVCGMYRIDGSNTQVCKQIRV